jgi:ABC-2 type transport system ATP-binding protein
MAREVVRVERIVKDVRPGFGLRRKRILEDVSFEVREGEIFGFVGPNGSGKTTTLKILMGLIRATSGSASILDQPVGSTASRRHVGFLPENPYFYDHLTGREILRFYARLSGVEARGREARVEQLLGWVNLRDAANGRLRTYSKGMLQRIGIAQALIHDPSVIFLDEPMSGLDPIGRKEIRDLILRLRGEGKTLFMNTHILSDVEMLCDRVAIIVAGHIRYVGHIDDFIADGDESRASVCDVVLENLAPEQVCEIEGHFGQEVRGQASRIELRIPAKQVDELLTFVIGGGASVVSVTPEHQSLERIFMQAVALESEGAESRAAPSGQSASEEAGEGRA